MGLGKIFGGTDKKTTESKSGVNVPSWYKEAERGSFDLINEISDRPYEAYEGERLAGFAGDQGLAQEGVRGQGQQSFAEAQRLASMQGANAMRGGPTAEQLQGLMNPYQQNVQDVNNRRMVEEADRQRQQIQGQASSMNAFGSGRSDLAQSRVGSNLQQQMADSQAQGLAGSYDRAMDQYNRGQGQLGQAATSSIQAGQGTLQGLQALNTSGAQQQLQDQAGLDLDYANYREEKDYDLQRYGLKQQGLQGVNTGLFSRYNNSTTTTPNSGWGGKLAGAAMQLGGAYMTGGGSFMGGGGGGSNFGAGYSSTPYSGNQIAWNGKDGGLVPEKNKYANGGLINSLGGDSNIPNFLKSFFQADKEEQGLPDLEPVETPSVQETGDDMIWGNRLGKFLKEKSGEVGDYLSDIPQYENKQGKKMGGIANMLAPLFPDTYKQTRPEIEGSQEALGDTTSASMVNPEIPASKVNKIPAFSDMQNRIKPQASTPEDTRTFTEKFKEWQANPLTQMGAKMMSSDKDIFGALGDATKLDPVDPLKAAQTEEIKKRMNDPEYREYELLKAGRGKILEAKIARDNRDKAIKAAEKELETHRDALMMGDKLDPNLEAKIYEKYYTRFGVKGAKHQASTAPQFSRAQADEMSLEELQAEYERKFGSK